MGTGTTSKCQCVQRDFIWFNQKQSSEFITKCHNVVNPEIDRRIHHAQLIGVLYVSYTPSNGIFPS